MQSNSTPGKAYPDYVAGVVQRLGSDEGLRNAVGGDFIATGVLEAQLIKSLGLRAEHFVIDVGCGSGRLAYQLSGIPTLQYLGTDVVPELLAYARKTSARPDWEFRHVTDCVIPAKDSTADFVCFFSVFTHLLHEQSFRYLKEAARVLKPGGRVVLSFLEFRLSAHWQVFEDSLLATDQHLNQFIERTAIHAWAQKLGLVVESVIDGDIPSIPLDRELTWPDGTVMVGKGNLGQSIAVLVSPDDRAMRDMGADIEQDIRPFASPVCSSSDTARAGISSISVRGFVDAADSVLIAGARMETATHILVTASGHALLRHGIRNTLSAPHLIIYDSSGHPLTESRGWRHLTTKQLAEVNQAMQVLGVPPLDGGGDDCALVARLPAGTYSFVVRSRSDRGGVVHLQMLPLPAA